MKATFPDNERYWTTDSLGKPPSPGDPIRTILISGSGDGALIDLARAAIVWNDPAEASRYHGTNDANKLHGRLVEFLADDDDIREFGKRLSQVDKVAERRQFLANTPEEAKEATTKLNNAYLDVFLGFEKKEHLEQKFRAVVGKRRDTVHFSPRSKGVFKLDSILFNRVIAFLLLEFGYAERLELGGITTCKVDGLKRIVTFDRDPKESSHRYDKVIARFGPNRIESIKEIQDIDGASEELGGKIARLEIASELDRSTFAWYSDKLREVESKR